MTNLAEHNHEQSGAPTGRRSTGLRERKKAKTRAAIQEHALRLFAAQGYEATTIEQIADAAEVSPSTVFRYFASKEDLVVSDEYDPLFPQAFRAQDPSLSPIEALRQAIRATLSDLTPDQLSAQRHRDFLIVTVPELWAASLGNVTRTIGTMAQLLAERAGRSPDDPAVRALSAAVFGVMFDVMLRWAKEPELDTVGELDRLLSMLDGGELAAALATKPSE
ncbi:TetR family transcriptional regulator [Micromonospora sp. NPDC051196]|uniref:TetR/AcrR family transcriptional regulator n=1 Tax=Micromonospora sp. NPDC051196 TaxID=3155281 RepID=UPI003432FFC1